MGRPQRQLAVSFVVTVAATMPGCKETRERLDPGGNRKVNNGSILTGGSTGCRYFQSVSCPENATCNPPPPREIFCPADKKLGGPSPSSAIPIPAGWVRFKPQVYVHGLKQAPKCSFSTDGKCPVGETQGRCQHSRHKNVPCAIIAPDAGASSPDAAAAAEASAADAAASDAGSTKPRVRVESFLTRRIDNTCGRYPAFECTWSGPCDPPKAKPEKCDGSEI